MMSKCARVMARMFSSDTTVVPRHSPRTFSGIQPTGTLHLGNYLGAVKRWCEELAVKSGAREEHLFCVVDLHAITLPQNPDTLRRGCREMTASLVACGLDPKRCVLFQQSRVKQHAELCWILGTLSTVPRLGQMTQYKEKSARLKEVPLGLFLYPILQAADILLYKATDVPVGEDNLQNIQIAQHLAAKFNSTFRPFFPRPRAILPGDNTARLRSLRNPEKKMSKSDPDPGSCIFINDPTEVLREKVKKSVTDSIREVEYDPLNRPGVANLILIQASLSGQPVSAVAEELTRLNKVELKELVANTLDQHLAPIRTEMQRILQDTGYLDSILGEGERCASELAEETLLEVKKLVGLL